MMNNTESTTVNPVAIFQQHPTAATPGAVAAAVPAYVNDRLHGGGKAFLFVRSVGTMFFPQVEPRRLVALDSVDLNAVRAANRQVNSSCACMLACRVLCP